MGLRIQYHWRTGTQVVKGTKCAVYRCPSFDSWWNQKNKRQNILFRRTTQAQPTHMTQITHTWCRVQLWKAVRDSYVWIPNFVARETSNDRFAIPEPILPIASKMKVTYYPRVFKKKNKGALMSLNKQTMVLLWAQRNKQGCSYELKQQTKVLLRAQTNKQRCSYELKRIYIYGVHLGLLPQTSPSGTCLLSLSLLVRVRLLPRGDLGLYLYLYLFYDDYMFNSCRIYARILYDVPACSTLEGYVHKFRVLPFWLVWGFMPTCSILVGYMHKFYVIWDLCLHIQFL